MSKYGVISGPHFPVFGLNTEIYGVNLRIQSEYRKIRTRKTLCLDIFHAVNILPTSIIVFPLILIITLMILCVTGVLITKLSGQMMIQLAISADGFSLIGRLPTRSRENACVNI